MIDDDCIVLRSLDRLLKLSGFATETYRSGEAFLAGAASSRANCLLLDVHLGGMSGLELRRKLTESGSELPVIFMTAVDDDVTREAATQAGCIGVLRKPFAATVLIAAIEAAAS